MYCTEVWGSAAKCHINRVHLIQKAAVRTIHGLPFSAHTASSFRNSLIFNIFQLYKYKILQHVYKAVKYNTCSYLFSNVTRHVDLHSHNTRFSNNLILPFYHMSASHRSVSYSGPKYWNEIEDDIKNSVSLSVFRKKLKDSMFS